MDESTIQSLTEALLISPENIPLRQHLADILVKMNRFNEAEKEYTELLKLSPEPRFKTELARVFFLQGEYSKCNVILEDVIEQGMEDFDVLILYTRGLLRENAIDDAISIYQRALEIEPGFYR